MPDKINFPFGEARPREIHCGDGGINALVHSFYISPAGKIAAFDVERNHSITDIAEIRYFGCICYLPRTHSVTKYNYFAVLSGFYIFIDKTVQKFTRRNLFGFQPEILRGKIFQKRIFIVTPAERDSVA